jgi:hypothetical protein
LAVGTSHVCNSTVSAPQELESCHSWQVFSIAAHNELRQIYCVPNIAYDFNAEFHRAFPFHPCAWEPSEMSGFG